MLQEIYSEFKSTPKVRLDYIPHPQLQHTKLLHSIRSRAVVQYSFQFAKIKKERNHLSGHWSHSSSTDGCRCTELSRSTFPLCVRWGFLRDNQTKSDKRNISPGVLTTENCDVFCLQQPSSLFWTLSVTSLETISDCVGNVFVCVRACVRPPRESIVSVGVDWWDRRADSVFVSSITFRVQ